MAYVGQRLYGFAHFNRADRKWSYNRASSSSSTVGRFFVLWFHLFFFQYSSSTNKNYLMVTLSAHQQCHLFLRSIEDWDVSKITDMLQLFQNQGSCNPNIGSWDVSKVTDFVSQSIAHSAYSQAKRSCKDSNTILLFIKYPYYFYNHHQQNGKTHPNFTV